MVLTRAEARGVLVRPLPHCAADTPAEAGLSIGFGAIPTAKLDEGTQRLAASFRASR